MDDVAPLLPFSLSSGLYLVWIVLAAVRMCEHPTGSRLVLLVLKLAGTTLTLLTPLIMARNGLSAAEMGFRLGWVQLLSTLLSSGAWVLLLLALSWRTAR